jgi:hypothetical protein
LLPLTLTIATINASFPFENPPHRCAKMKLSFSRFLGFYSSNNLPLSCNKSPLFPNKCHFSSNKSHLNNCSLPKEKLLSAQRVKIPNPGNKIFPPWEQTALKKRTVRLVVVSGPLTTGRSPARFPRAARLVGLSHHGGKYGCLEV